jgi:hypothetical protein
MTSTGEASTRDVPDSEQVVATLKLGVGSGASLESLRTQALQKLARDVSSADQQFTIVEAAAQARRKLGSACAHMRSMSRCCPNLTAGAGAPEHRACGAAEQSVRKFQRGSLQGPAKPDRCIAD